MRSYGSVTGPEQPSDGPDEPPDEAYGPRMCRSIQTLRPPYTESVTPDDVRAAALQYVRKISGMRSPAPHNREAFDRAVDDVTAATEALLRDLVVRGSRSAGAPART